MQLSRLCLSRRAMMRGFLDADAGTAAHLIQHMQKRNRTMARGRWEYEVSAVSGRLRSTHGWTKRRSRMVLEQSSRGCYLAVAGRFTRTQAALHILSLSLLAIPLRCAGRRYGPRMLMFCRPSESWPYSRLLEARTQHRVDI